MKKQAETVDLFRIHRGPEFRVVKPPKSIKPLGATSPLVWSIEPAFGCNLKCAHCCADLIPKAANSLMCEEIWRSAFSVLNSVSPSVRVDLCGFVG